MPNTFQIDSLSDLIDFVDGFDRSNMVLFRGQQREQWPLLPKIARIKKGACTLKDELDILTEFKKGAYSFIHNRPANEWGWLAIAQHHGLATRVLDWSLNPLVALWFAVKDAPHEDRNGILWMYSLNQRSVINTLRLDEEPDPFKLDRVKVFFPNHEVPRIRAQAGVFTVHPRVMPNKVFLPFEEMQIDHESLTRMIIPCGLFEKLKRSLDKCGIHAAALMPDLDGLAQRIIFNHDYS
ncbi:MAG TPA: FRG domain-containing protein [Anaerolineales bacterium]|nr:FRG domain-containing protein [Anaerolineales bacterium]